MLESGSVAVQNVRDTASKQGHDSGGVCCTKNTRLVTKRRSGWACIGNPKLEQESIEGTRARETPAYQRRPTTLHEVQGSNPLSAQSIRALYMQLAMIPHHTACHHCARRR